MKEQNIEFYKEELLGFVNNKIERYFIRTFLYKVSLFRYVKYKMLSSDDYKNFYLKHEDTIEEELRIVTINFDNIVSSIKYGLGDICAFLDKYYKSPIFIHGRNNQTIIVNHKYESINEKFEDDSIYPFFKLTRNGNVNISTNNKISQGNRQIAIFEKDRGNVFVFVGYFVLFDENEDLFLFKPGKVENKPKKDDSSNVLFKKPLLHHKHHHNDEEDEDQDNPKSKERTHQYKKFQHTITNEFTKIDKNHKISKLQKNVLEVLNENTNVDYNEYIEILKSHKIEDLKNALYIVIKNYYRLQLIRANYSSELFRSRDYENITLVPIKPWDKLIGKERLDFSNFLFIRKTLATLFTNGYFTFDDKGSIVLGKFLSENITNDDFKNLNIHIFGSRKQFLQYHRDNIFDKEK